MIQRTDYIEKIRPYIGKNVIKVLTGIRRCGKSCLLKMLKDTLVADGVSPESMVFANFESRLDDSVRSVDAMYGRVRGVADRRKGGGKTYLFFDEIQEVAGWEKLINSMTVDFDVDVYITGSNAKLLSSELSTYLGGRYVEFPIFPFSFKEAYPILQANGLERRDAFAAYLRLGGMPFLYDAQMTEDGARAYLLDIFSSVVLKDIALRHKVRDIDMLERFLGYLVSEIAHPFSAVALTRYLKHERRGVGLETIYNYLRYAIEACFAVPVKRYDLVGKELLSTQEKVYIADHGFREAMFGLNGQHIDRVLENVVAIELMRRGWEVTVGRLRRTEVDFVASKGNERAYFQIAYMMPTEETRRREFAPLAAIGDNFPKYVLTLDDVNFSEGGVIHMPFADFLLS